MKNDPFIHPNAIVEARKQIGLGTRVWAFAHILPGAVIGEDCNICDHVFIENDVMVGNRVTVKSGVQLWDGIRLEDDVFVGPNVAFTNDPFPRSKKYPEKFAVTVVQKGASIGANATILPGLIIGSHAMVGAGSVVTHDVPPGAIVAGNPAYIRGYVDASPADLDGALPQEAVYEARVQGVRLIPLPHFLEPRGNLVFGEYQMQLPFVPQRFFVVYHVPDKVVRGEHAHKTQHQFLVCLRGSVSVIVDNGRLREEILLDKPNAGLYIPPMIWGNLYKYSEDALLLVLASDKYDRSDYVQEYVQYLEMISAQN